MPQQYGDGTNSTIGTQIIDFNYIRKALIDEGTEQYFHLLSDTIYQPRNAGKTIKRNHYIPLLDDRNINDQGLDANGATYVGGNLWGSSKDIGYISGRLPLGNESGGQRNRVGYSRNVIEGTIARMDFYDEYTLESVQFDTDKEIRLRIAKEAVKGAMQISETVLQIDLINGAGIVKYGGVATQRSEITGENGAIPSILTYEMLMNTETTLDDNKCPKDTQIISGSTYTDTRTIPASRFTYLGSPLKKTLERMKNLHNEKAFLHVHHYSDGASKVMNGEIGSVGSNRIIVHPEMLFWEGTGAPVVSNDGYRETGGNYDVFPVLTVGSGSFTTLGFQTDGKKANFDINHKPPSKENSTKDDPHGDIGFYAVKWYYGTMIWRDEWIAREEVVAEI